MEFVGETINKEFKGIGVVESFDPALNLFEVRYENGGSEQMGESEIAALVVERDGEMGSGKPCSSSKAGEKKQGRNCGSRSEEEEEFSLDNANCEEKEENFLKRTSVCIDLNVDANSELEESIMKDTSSWGVLAEKRDHCFDLNMGLDEVVTTLDDMKEEENNITIPKVVKETQEQDMDGGSDCKEGEKFAETGGGSDSKEHEEVWFDASEGAHSGDDIVMRAYGKIEVGDLCSDGTGKDCTSSRRSSKGGLFIGVADPVGFTTLEDQLEEEILEVCTPPVQDKQENSLSPGTERKVKRRKRLSESANSGAETALRRSRRLATGGGSSVEIVENVQKQIGVSGRFEGYFTPGVVDAIDLMASDGKYSDDGTPLNHSYQGNSGSSRRGRKRRERMEFQDNGSPVTETLLRRTSRRLAAALSTDKEAQSSAEVGVISKEPFTTSAHQELEEINVFPPKLKLPRSSDKLDLDGIPILDFFSVYTCLRSFSTLLFLSPFDLEDFLAALKCDKANTLFDSIHVSLLQTLRKHLDLLSNENILSASNCLRNLSWDLLDSITWPVFMVNYLLTHGSALKSDFDLTKLKLLDSEYYKQGADVKIEILRCLCDDVIEVEAIRSELNRRTLATDPNMDFDRNLKTVISKRRRISLDVSGGSCLTEEVIDETADWNSDDCCLCKMDGSLICCDGCPAAYHMKCVGVANNSLPDGDWYCPECVINKDKPWLNMGKSLRGAEILGVDPYGRLYSISAGCLLVLDSCDNEPSCRYYHMNDLTALVEAMKSADPLYKPILNAISKHLSIYANSSRTKSNIGSYNPSTCLERMKEQNSTTSVVGEHVAPLELDSRYGTLVLKHPEDHSIAAQYSGNMECNYLAKSEKMENMLTSSEGSVETSHISVTQNFPTAGSDVFKQKSVLTSDDSQIGTILTIRDNSLRAANLYGDGELGKNIQMPECGHESTMANVRRAEDLQGKSRINYINYYSFAHTSSMVARELTRRSADKITDISTKSVEDIISSQLKAISKRYTKFSWPIFQNVGADAKKEKCGWCFACRTPNTDHGSRGCFFNLNITDPHSFDDKLVRLCSQQSNDGHLLDVICYILCMEDRLRGLLQGPWLNLHYSELWRQNVMKVSDVASLKYFLLMLEANLHRLVVAPDWIKFGDSVTTMGSASYIATSSSRVSSKEGIGRKRARCSDVEAKLSFKAVSGLSLLWWRGGRLSRKLFNWKVLPHGLASKAARQAGCKKVPGILYPDSSDFTKRSRSVIWKSAVEASRSVEQLALQVRELDTNIRWDDIENTHPLLKMDQYRKSARLFKKAIIRRKLTEGTVVKYLLDFGKRRFIPDIVVTHGSKVEESSSGRKKYWLEDTHVPLHLLKAFEERRITRKCNKMNLGKHHWSDRLKKTFKRKGFHYLFAKAEQSEYYQCGHCNKDILIREAVCCMYCKGHFHKRHVKKSPGAKAAECTFSCHKCQGRQFVNLETKKGEKPVSHNGKNIPVGSRVLRPKMNKKAYKDVIPAQKKKNKKIDSVALPLRRSPRKLKFVPLPNKKVGKRKKGKAKGKQIKSASNGLKKPKKNFEQKKRTQAYHAYWLNGIFFSRKKNDERVEPFKCKSLVTPSGLPSVSMASPPKCGLCCEQDFMPSLSYVSCEICEAWFHGDAYGLTMEKMDCIIGFRCHKCRDRTSPICPHIPEKKNNEAKSGEVNTCNGDEAIKIPSFSGQSSPEEQERGDISSPILGQSIVENGKLLESGEQRIEAVEHIKDDSLAENAAVPMDTDLIER